MPFSYAFNSYLYTVILLFHHKPALSCPSSILPLATSALSHSPIPSLTHSSWHVCVDVASRTIRLNTSLFWASLPASVGLIGSYFFMSSVHLLVGRPFLLLPSSLASNMCLSRESCLYRWPKYDSFLDLMLFNNQSWPTFSSFRISVFFLFAIHGILSILL